MLNFVPSEFIIPEKMETEEYRLRMLSIDDVEKDFEAVISSAEHVLSLIHISEPTRPY